MFKELCCFLKKKKKESSLIAAHHGQSECQSDFKATSQSKCVANKTCCSPSQTKWLVNILHNLRPDCLMIKFSSLFFLLPRSFVCFENELQKSIKLKTIVIKYATFPRCVPLGQKPFSSVFVDVNVVVDGEMLANSRLTQQKEWGSLNVADENKHCAMWGLPVLGTRLFFLSHLEWRRSGCLGVTAAHGVREKSVILVISVVIAPLLCLLPRSQDKRPNLLDEPRC